MACKQGGNGRNASEERKATQVDGAQTIIGQAAGGCGVWGTVAAGALGGGGALEVASELDEVEGFGVGLGGGALSVLVVFGTGVAAGGPGNVGGATGGWGEAAGFGAPAGPSTVADVSTDLRLCSVISNS